MIKEEKDFLLKNKWKDLKLIELEEEKDFYLKNGELWKQSDE